MLAGHRMPGPNISGPKTSDPKTSTYQLLVEATDVPSLGYKVLDRKSVV